MSDTLPPPVERAFRAMERRSQAVVRKIDDAVAAITPTDDESSDDIANGGIDFDDPSVVRSVDDLRGTSVRSARLAKASVAPR